MNVNNQYRLSNLRLQKLIQKLPEPFKRVSFGSSIFDLYLVKPSFSSEWKSTVLKNILLEARKSYLRYGDVALLDEYDKKSVIYLCRVRYPYLISNLKKNISVEEWLSIRFIPGAGKPESTEDLDQYFYKKKNIGFWMKNLFFDKDRNYLKKVVTMSRICGITAFPTLSSNQNFLKYLPNRLQYSSLSFLLLNDSFFSSDFSKDFDYLTGVFRDELLKKIFLSLKAILHSNLFFPKAEILFRSKGAEIVLDRSIMAYNFPGYFLNVSHFVKMMQRLVLHKELTDKSLKYYIPNFKMKNFINIKEVKYTEMLVYLKGLGKMLTLNGLIRGSKLTGERLRVLINKEVEDGPCLHIVSTKYWRRQVSMGTNKFLKLKQKKISSRKRVLALKNKSL